VTDLNIGLVGLGYWGGNLLRTFGRTDGARITAVCDEAAAQRTAVAASLGDTVAVYDRVEALCADPAVNAVAVATPPSTHVAVARLALRAG
jgi:predicted dehydrogenase